VAVLALLVVWHEGHLACKTACYCNSQRFSLGVAALPEENKPVIVLVVVVMVIFRLTRNKHYHLTGTENHQFQTAEL